MSTRFFDLKKQRETLLARSEAIIRKSEESRGELTQDESADVDACMAGVNAINPQITQLEKQNTVLSAFKGGVDLIVQNGRTHTNPHIGRKHLSDQYPNAFFEYVASGGKRMDAALYEGSESGGGYAVPITVDDQIVPLAPQEMAVRQLANVIPTVSDIKIPVKASFGTASAKAELSAFTEADPTLSQITLSAYMAGIQEIVSWELAQDVPAFQAFAVDDMVLAQQMYEENLYVNGTGSGQAQGLIGNVGVGYGPQEPDGNGNLVSITGLLNLMGTLNAVYHPNASFLMSRPTSIVIRKAQVESNLFYPAFTRDANNQDRLFGFPVFYSASMPNAARGETPVLFGDFKRGYVIGDRGGSGINVKVLDQPLATQGEIILLAYRRTDGRVRRSEAIQAYTVSAS